MEELKRMLKKYLEVNPFKKERLLRLLKIEEISIKEKTIEIVFDASNYYCLKGTDFSKKMISQMEKYLPDVFPFKGKIYIFKISESNYSRE